MDQELFNPQSSSVSSSRIIYTPSTFARTSLLHLQEVGSLRAVHPHVSQREDLVSFLCFIVLSGEGTLSYEEQTYQLGQGDCVFIDCRKAYSHSKFDNLWSLQWCHFYAPSLPAVYEKYKERGGRPVFHPGDLTPFTSLLTDLYNLASSSDYIRDMQSMRSWKVYWLSWWNSHGIQRVWWWAGREWNWQSWRSIWTSIIRKESHWMIWQTAFFTLDIFCKVCLGGQTPWRRNDFFLKKL